ncbi:aKG-HExxH-type peptide beta-hydroxylase [Dactylosporangium salmoneum]|uniref:HEXXH motif domain-containing protein n=1 Tax=Dactylosporangium salmoneum TaxID=53361 RepID=A0ABP5SAS7_9ACTN
MIRPHTLTVDQLDELAGGYGSAGTHRLLAATQKSKRMLMLLALDEAADPGVRRAERFDEALALFARAQAAAPAAADEVLHDPFFGVWTADAIRAPARCLRLFAAYAAAAAARAGLAFRIEVPVRHGLLTLPGIGTFGGLEGDSAVVEGGPDGLRAGPVRAAAPPTEEGPGWAPLRRLGAGIALEDADPHRDCFDWPPSARLDGPAAEGLRRSVEGALDLLDEHHPAHAAGIRATLRSLVPVTAPGGGNVSAASRWAFGAIAIEAGGGPADLALSLIHECRHMTLGAVLDLVDLYEAGGPARHFAPWRADPRTVSALLQGTYAHAGVTDFWRVERRRTGAAAAEFEFAYWLAQTSAGARSLLASGELTPRGVRFVTRLAETLRGWRSEAVRGDVLAAATASALAVGVQWRLDNAHPDPGGVDRLAAAWRGGADCPAPPSVLIRPAPARPARVPAVADRARRLVVGEDRLAPGEGDGGGEPGADVWLRLALAAGSGPLVEHPEVVRAVSRATGADPLRLADWITSGAARYRS